MPRSAYVDHFEFACADDTVEMRVDEIQARRGPPMTKKPRLYMFGAQRLTKQWIVSTDVAVCARSMFPSPASSVL